MEDYRTEILGLMKAQTVKNSIIVPVGAKGGFVARRLPVDGSRDEIMAEVVACYKTFVQALLDVTDNIVDDQIVPPASVTRHDGDDPYLVVAADKGTATFSDTANEIAAESNFWLDDAFASGGSAGYDHKALAITARGAWVSVERHFRELGMNPASTPFTAVGVGDMSGDVFGNGLLRSDKTKLIAAFDHRHVFVDPAPDPAASFAERARLYELPRSSWADYDTELISAGGGVFARSAKSIDVTTEMGQALGIDASIGSMTPDELIQAVLRAPVDLLWNGGIGTYIRASDETDLEVGDRGNDAVRVAATELRCKVIAEGGNLGVSQRGRIEFSSTGGRINTDAIDNSGGVDCSDHEVNLKILLAIAERSGDLTRKQRNLLLESMAEEVCEHVLETNYAQNEALSIAVAEATGMTQVHERLMRRLEASAGLDRAVEQLPTTTELRDRHERGLGLTRPELAVLLAYTKNSVTDEITRGDLPANGEFDELLLRYFPSQIRSEHGALVRDHPLRDELVAMLLSNDVVNRGGISMIHRLEEETSAQVVDVCIAHQAAWRIYDLEPLAQQVRALDKLVIARVQTQLHLAITRLGERATRWLLRNEPQPIDIGKVVHRYSNAIRVLQERAATVEWPDDVAAQVLAFTQEGVPDELAHDIAALGPAFGYLDLTNAATSASVELEAVASMHALLDERLDLSRLRDWIVTLPRDDHWETMARSALRDQYFLEHAELTATVLAATVGDYRAGSSVEQQVDSWLAEHQVAVERCRRTFAEIESSTELNHQLAHASVAVRALTQLRRST